MLRSKGFNPALLQILALGDSPVRAQALRSGLAGDFICVPIFAWHQHFNAGDEPARLLVHSNRIAMENLGYAVTQQGEPAR